MKSYFLIIITFIFLNTISIYGDSISTSVNSYFENETLYISIEITNNSEETIYIPISEWKLIGNNTMSDIYPKVLTVLPKISFTIIPNIDSNYKEELGPRTIYHNEYYIKFLEIKPNDNKNIKLNIMLRKNIILPENDYRIFLNIPYTDTNNWENIIDLNIIDINDIIIDKAELHLSFNESEREYFANYYSKIIYDYIFNYGYSIYEIDESSRSAINDLFQKYLKDQCVIEKRK